MTFISRCAYDLLDLGGDSDENIAESSEDDIEIFLHGTPKQRRRLRRLSEGRNDSSSEDDFEKEMDTELQSTVDALEALRETKEKKDVKTENQGASTSSTTTSSTAQFYDSIYFDSDEEEESSSGKTGSKRKHPVISNDDLLYDPNMDGDDQKWVDRQRVWCRPQTNTSRRNEKVKPLPSSDAVLDCPACMTTLCMDCQRHSTYSNQYRAMFVMNCVVDTSEILKYPKEIGKKKNKKKKRQSNRETTPDQTDDDKYNPVKCTECGTVVAMFDQDEVYHFFNILASHS
ncbi:E2F-associated phosphoprotein-like isoform X2 [Gigantopelta aegis]|uniref:E2F-associated phosphoprotein-like isoform X2 n=1 Tax=Gigantopelta aegis TaxID=1735272 RepID=UPI001B888926|nr:E2F-associated phosphoprotein-like isoform X2 [Gigantopelta aegis]